MFATLEFHRVLEDKAVLVPAMAVIDTGTRKVAYVMGKPGEFEPRQLETGVRSANDEWQVLSGLAPGEKVVVSGQFLIDSESNLREATLNMLHPGLVNTEKVFGKGPEAGAGMKEAPAKEKLGPVKYVCPMPAHAGILYDKPGNCPLCGMKLVPTEPWSLTESPIAYYTCPLPEHASVHEAKPGKCPICGMTLVPVTQDEAKRFQETEDKSGTAVPKTLYTCPMPSDADVVSDKPGKCPKCGMELVPTSTVAHGKEAEALWHKEHPEEKAPEQPAPGGESKTPQ
jgi:rubrerythrin